MSSFLFLYVIKVYLYFFYLCVFFAYFSPILHLFVVEDQQFCLFVSSSSYSLYPFSFRKPPPLLSQCNDSIVSPLRSYSCTYTGWVHSVLVTTEHRNHRTLLLYTCTRTRISTHRHWDRNYFSDITLNLATTVAFLVHIFTWLFLFSMKHVVELFRSQFPRRLS